MDKKLGMKTFIIHERTPDGWKLTKRTNDPKDIHPLEWWYFNHIMQEDLDYIVVGDTMYDILYHREFAV